MKLKKMGKRDSTDCDCVVKQLQLKTKNMVDHSHQTLSEIARCHGSINICNMVNTKTDIEHIKLMFDVRFRCLGGK